MDSGVETVKEIKADVLNNSPTKDTEPTTNTDDHQETRETATENQDDHNTDNKKRKKIVDALNGKEPTNRETLLKEESDVESTSENERKVQKHDIYNFDEDAITSTPRGRGRGRGKGRGRGRGRGTRGRGRGGRSRNTGGNDSDSPYITSDEEGPSRITCSICRYDDSPKHNRIVICDMCNICYHQICHDPRIPKSVVDEPLIKWYCRQCSLKKIAEEIESIPSPPEETPIKPEPRVKKPVTPKPKKEPKKAKSPEVMSPPSSIKKPGRRTRPIPLEVDGTGLTEEQKYEYFRSLSHSQLVRLLLEVESKHSSFPYFPESIKHPKAIDQPEDVDSTMDMSPAHEKTSDPIENPTHEAIELFNEPEAIANKELPVSQTIHDDSVVEDSATAMQVDDLTSSEKHTDPVKDEQQAVESTNDKDMPELEQEANEQSQPIAQLDTKVSPPDEAAPIPQDVHKSEVPSVNEDTMEVDEPQVQNTVSNGAGAESVPITSEVKEDIEPLKDTTNSIPSSETTDGVIIAPSSDSTEATNIEDAKSIEPAEQSVEDDSQKNESTDLTSDQNGVESNPTPDKDTLDGQPASHDEA